jgi:signal transduction histidine kinase
VSGDRLVLCEALTNVLDNAIKYSPDGATIAIRVERIGDQALLAIGDQGPGIPPEHRERIFHRFFRVDEARSRARGGAGLGLAYRQVGGRYPRRSDHRARAAARRFRIPYSATARAAGGNRCRSEGNTGTCRRVIMKAFFIACVIVTRQQWDVRPSQDWW